jgi:AraC-like DNA-binding protein
VGGSGPTQLQLAGDSEAAARWSESATASVTPHRHACMHPAIRVVLTRVSERLAEQWTLSHVASLVGYNPSYLCWLFHSETGTSFHGWLEACRIDRSKHLLICDVAAEVGYSNSAFGRAFHRRVGMSPRTFRSMHQRIGERLPAEALNTKAS